MKVDKPIKRTVEISSTAAEFEEPGQWLLEQLGQLDYTEGDIFAIHLAVQEAFYNAIKHGNKMDERKKVKLEMVVSNDRVEIWMTDSGSGFNPNAVPDCREGDNLYKPDGRGLLLMRSYMDTVEYNEKGNCVHMVRNRHNDNGGS
jgi:serine/threonine-protein kinase RsbW